MAKEKVAKIKRSDKKVEKKVPKKKNENKKSYIQEVRSELKKVKWPTKQEMFKYSVAVIIFIVVFGLYFYGLDALFAWISSLVKGL